MGRSEGRVFGGKCLLRVGELVVLYDKVNILLVVVSLIQRYCAGVDFLLLAGVSLTLPICFFFLNDVAADVAPSAVGTAGAGIAAAVAYDGAFAAAGSAAASAAVVAVADVVAEDASAHPAPSVARPSLKGRRRDACQ